MTDRWATFDCYGTLIDWYAGIRGVMRRVWPNEDAEHLLSLHHAVEPLVQAGRKLPYRHVGARTLRAIAAIEGLSLTGPDEFALADTLPDWPAFVEVQQFFQRTGADPAYHVHVAASLFHDIAPAQQLGLTAVWINRLGERSDLPRAAELADLRGLPDTLNRLVP